MNNPGQSANYYTSYTDYDSRGRANRQVSATGTIQETVFDGLGREVSTWVGTNDTTTTQVNLTSAFVLTGITADGTLFSGGLDGSGDAYSGTLLNGTVSWNTLPFGLGPVGANDAVVASGQALTLPTGNDTALSLLATAVNGNQTNQTFTVTYTDGSTQNFSQSLSGWLQPMGYTGEATAVTMAYRNKADGTMDHHQVYLYGYSLALDPTRQVQSLTLPNNAHVLLLAATLTNAVWSPTTNTAPSNMVQVTANAYDGNGVMPGVGDSTLTQAIQYVVANDLTTARVTQNVYDYRDRLVASKSGVQNTETAGTHRPISYTQYDNQSEVTLTEQFDGDGVPLNQFLDANGMPQTAYAGLLRARSTTAYDDDGRPFQATVYNVDTSGMYSPYGLTSNQWYDLRGNLIKNSQPGGQVTKTQYDGAGRPYVTYVTNEVASPSWTEANSVASNLVLTQTETTYDADSNPTLVTTRDRFHDETRTGPLSDPFGGPDPMHPLAKARASYVATYYDPANRTIATADFGTNHAQGPLTIGAQPPMPSDMVLVTRTGYVADTLETVTLTGGPTGGTFKLLLNGQPTAAISCNAGAAAVQTALAGVAGNGNVLVTGPAGAANAAGGPWTVRFTGSLAGTSVALLTADPSGLTGGTMPNVALSLLSQAGDAGRVQQVTDPRGLVQKTDDDLLGRSVRTVQAFSNAATPPANSNITTESTYDGDGHQVTLQADLANGSFQRTQYNYGIASPIVSTDLLASMQYPDKTTGLPSTQLADQESYGYNLQGEMTSKIDRNGTAHAYTFDVLGRQTVDAVTIPTGSPVDTAVQRLETAYDSYGNAYQFTSYNAMSGGTMVNQVQQTFDGFGHLTAESQNHGGTIPIYTVLYAYNSPGMGINYSREVSMTYPSVRTLTYTYGVAGSLDDQISRLTAISDSTGVLESYTDNNGVSAYLGLDTVVQRSHSQASLKLTYIQPGGSADAGDQYVGLDRFGRVVNQLWVQNGSPTDSFQYGYDRDSNRVYRDNLIKPAFGEIYHAAGAVDTYDGSGNLLTLGYDPANEITQFNRGTLTGDKTGIQGTASLNQQWTFDALGNWTTFVNGATTDNRAHNQQNQITCMNGGAPAYDSNGNTTQYANAADGLTRNLVYDAWNRLVKVTSGSTTLAAYSYDALGRRIQEVEANFFGDTVTRDLYFSADWQVLEERETGATYTNLLRAQYVWSPLYVDALVERDRDPARTGSGALSERFYAQQDANWNVTALVSASGNVTERYVYDPFGNATVYDLNWNNPSATSLYAWIYLHQDARYDKLTGLYSFRHRDYSPTLGRWMENDPLGYMGGGLNLYDSLGDRPVATLDPEGTRPLDIKAAAFIPGRLGTWLPQPGPSLHNWQFKTDERDFGGDFTRSRVRSWASVESSLIGRVKDIHGGHDSGTSERRRRAYTFDPTGSIVFSWYNEQAKAAVEGEEWFRNGTSGSGKCFTYVHLDAKASYPFISYAPSIKYEVRVELTVVGLNKVRLWYWVKHTEFPNFEATVDGYYYRYSTGDDGPGLINLNTYRRDTVGGSDQPVVVDAETPKN